MSRSSNALREYRQTYESGGQPSAVLTYTDCQSHDGIDYCLANYPGDNNNRLEAIRNGQTLWGVWLRTTDVFRSLAIAGAGLGTAAEVSSEVAGNRIALIVERSASGIGIDAGADKRLVSALFDQGGTWLYDIDINVPAYSSVAGNLSVRDSFAGLRYPSFLDERHLFFTLDWSVLMPPCFSVCFPGELSVTHQESGVTLVKLDVLTGQLTDFAHSSPNDRKRDFSVEATRVIQEMQPWDSTVAYGLVLSR